MAKRKDNTTKLILKVVIGQTADGKEKLASAPIATSTPSSRTISSTP